MSRVSFAAPSLKPARLLLLAITAALLASGPRGTFAAASPPTLQRIGTLSVPGKPLEKFDIGFVNADGIYAFADRSNRALDLFSTATGRFLGRATGFSNSGPKGVVAVGRQEFWAGDGDSGTVKVVDVRSHKIVASILTERGKSTDELTYDPRDHVVAVVSKHDGPPFLNFISTRSRRLVGRVRLTHATDGAEQSVWDPATGLIYLSLPVLDQVEAHGAVAVIDPRTYTLVKLFPVDKCVPAGLVLGPRNDMLVGCSDDAVAAGFPAESLIIDASSGKVVARLPQVGGSDEVWSDPTAGRYYFAAVANPGGPVLGVADSHTRTWIANLPTGPSAHSVAADAQSGKVFVPIAANAADGGCRRGCIAVYGSR
jgi:DNA-binding beta-propeller fold protein YncE